jgi:hypothetical protein
MRVPETRRCNRRKPVFILQSEEEAVITWVRIPYNLLTTKRTRKCEEVYLIL